MSKNYELVRAINRLVPGLKEIRLDRCPLLGADNVKWGCDWDEECSLYVLILHLNDDHEWTREQIADYVDYLADIHGEDMLSFPVTDIGKEGE